MKPSPIPVDLPSTKRQPSDDKGESLRMVQKFDELIMEPVCEPTDETAIRRLEERLGIRLPEQYRQFMLAYNGSFVDLNASIRYMEGDMENGLPLQCFFGLCDEDHGYSIESNLDEYVDGSRVMRSFLPIGIDQTDDLVCLKIKGDNVGSVYAWIFEEEAEPEDVEAENEAGWENMYFLAENFDQLIEKIRIETYED